MNPDLETYSHTIRTKIDQILEAIGELDGDDLNRAPELAGANSPFVIATHVLGNMRAWVLGIVCGQDLRRDRPAEFASRGTYENLTAAAGALSAEIDAALRAFDASRLDERFVPPQELFGEGTPREVSRRDGLAHALEHAGIHLGHIQMTVQLLKERPA